MLWNLIAICHVLFYHNITVYLKRTLSRPFKGINFLTMQNRINVKMSFTRWLKWVIFVLTRHYINGTNSVSSSLYINIYKNKLEQCSPFNSTIHSTSLRFLIQLMFLCNCFNARVLIFIHITHRQVLQHCSD